MSSPKVCVLVLNWNGAGDTIECIQSLKKVTYQNVKIVVIDNGSSDESVQRIKAAHGNVKIIELETNLLYGGGNNAGLQWAHEQDYDYVVFLNNDTIVESGFLEPLINGFETAPNVGMVAPLMCYSSSPELVWYGGGKVNLWTGVVEHLHIRQNVNQVEQKTKHTDYITGCCLMMPTRLAMELGGFNPSYKMYGEDVDLSLRARAAGYELLFIPESKIYHKVSASIGGEFSLKKMTRKLRGMVNLYKHHISWYQWPILIVGQFVYLLFKIISLLTAMFHKAKYPQGRQ